MRHIKSDTPGREEDSAIPAEGDSNALHVEFERVFGRDRPDNAASSRRLVGLIETPLGPMLAAASDRAICWLEFARILEPRNMVRSSPVWPSPLSLPFRENSKERGAGGESWEGIGIGFEAKDGDRSEGRLAREFERMRVETQRRFGVCIVCGTNPVLERLRVEVRDYFRGKGRTFTVPIELRGTEFQERVWEELQRIPYGATASYEAVAKRIGLPTGARAVARANATNRLCLIVPCHRVIAKNGALSGYSGGVWRKPLLLELERTGRLPQKTAPITGCQARPPASEPSRERC